MSDYISKSALIKFLKCYEKELHEDKKVAIETDDEMMLFAIANQETAIYRITRSVLYELPTVDEKEIIRKPLERIVERLESAAWWTPSTYDYDGYSNDDSEEVVYLDTAIKIVMEEGGVCEYT